MLMTTISARWRTNAPYFHTLLRIAAAAMFITSGTSKLFAFPEGMPPDGRTAQLLTQIGIGGLMEFVGGSLILIGLFTRPIAFLLSGEMAVAFFQFHFPQSYWPTINGGVGAALYCFVWLYFSTAGAGPLSLDSFFARHKRAVSDHLAVEVDDL
jgi:putative oxidoreductase